MAGKQVMAALTEPKVAMMIATDAAQRGAEVAVPEAVAMAIQHVQQVAQQSGTNLPPEVFDATRQAATQIIVTMLAEAGIVKDPKATLATIEQQVAQKAEPAGQPAGQQPVGHQPAPPLPGAPAGMLARQGA